MENRIISFEEFCKLFNCSEKVASELFISGKLKGNKVSRNWWTTQKNIIDYLEGKIDVKS
jgi:hypothetical protein